MLSHAACRKNHTSCATVAEMSHVSCSLVSPSTSPVVVPYTNSYITRIGLISEDDILCHVFKTMA